MESSIIDKKHTLSQHACTSYTYFFVHGRFVYFRYETFFSIFFSLRLFFLSFWFIHTKMVIYSVDLTLWLFDTSSCWFRIYELGAGIIECLFICFVHNVVSFYGIRLKNTKTYENIATNIFLNFRFILSLPIMLPFRS